MLSKSSRIFYCILLTFLFRFSNGNEIENGFIENKGQIVNQNYFPNSNVLYTYCGKGIKIQLRKNGYSYEVFSVKNSAAAFVSKRYNDLKNLSASLIQSHRVDIDFYMANENFKVIKEKQIPGYLNYFINGQEISNIHSFKKIIYKNVYPFTDIEFFVTGDSSVPLKYNIVLRPGSDINKVKFLCKGADDISLTTPGNLHLKTSLGIITEKIPLSYYSDSPSINRPVQFKVETNIVSFSAQQDQAKTLIIDPSSNIIWGTYYGDASLDRATCTGTDAFNNVYLAGYALSTSNIATAGTYQSTLSGSYDVYLAKFDTNGNRIWGTYFGGTNLETAYAMYVESNGNVYICGDTASPTNVASAGAHQTSYGGGMDDAILVKFDTNGQRLWSTYYGGNQHDIAYAITVDKLGNPIIAGHTESSNTANCIATPGAYATSFVFASDVFIAKFNSNGARQWGTYYGDSGFEETWGMDCDTSNNIIITGFSESLSGITTTPCHQAFNGGGQDAFIAKFNPTGNNLLWGTFFGGLGNEQGTSVAVDSTGMIFISGNTTSSTNISTAGSYQSNIASSDDAFLTAFSASGVQQWGTYFGGEDTDYMNDIVLDKNTNILACGQTLSNYSISTNAAYQPSLATVNSYDAFLARFTMQGKLQLASYYGGEADDNAKSIAVDNNGNVYLAGETTSTAGISTSGAFMQSSGGVGDGFLGKFCVAPEPKITPLSTPTLCMNANYTLTASTGYPFYFWNTGFNSNPLVITTTFTPGSYYYTVTVTDPYGCNGQSDSAKIVVANCVTRIEEIFESKLFEIFPVPATDVLYFISEDFMYDITVEIVNSTGQVVLSLILKNPTQGIDVSRLAPGVYTLKLSDDRKSYIKKFIKG